MRQRREVQRRLGFDRRGEAHLRGVVGRFVGVAPPEAEEGYPEPQRQGEQDAEYDAFQGNPVGVHGRPRGRGKGRSIRIMAPFAGRCRPPAALLENNIKY